MAMYIAHTPRAPHSISKRFNIAKFIIFIDYLEREGESVFACLLLLIFAFWLEKRFEFISKYF